MHDRCTSATRRESNSFGADYSQFDRTFRLMLWTTSSDSVRSELESHESQKLAFISNYTILSFVPTYGRHSILKYIPTRGEGGFLTKSHNTYIFYNNLKTTLKFRHYNRMLTEY